MVAVGWKFPPNVTNIQEENIRTRDAQLKMTRTEFYETFIEKVGLRRLKKDKKTKSQQNQRRPNFVTSENYIVYIWLNDIMT